MQLKGSSVLTLTRITHLKSDLFKKVKLLKAVRSKEVFFILGWRRKATLINFPSKTMTQVLLMKESQFQLDPYI